MQTQPPKSARLLPEAYPCSLAPATWFQGDHYTNESVVDCPWLSADLSDFLHSTLTCLIMESIFLDRNDLPSLVTEVGLKP
mmetsp:Transcript_1115/g.1852  ORF Transcript_1115/g.1852 Transcript_1115/m.1852 type:complete len:81 (+) Transcript_1115:268-510(+)